MFTKYYVESGPHLKIVVLATDEMDAMVKAFTVAYEAEPLLRLADMVIVNQRGFVWDREGHELYGDEFMLPTRLVLGLPEEEQVREET
jgi:hypothetical protein